MRTQITVGRAVLLALAVSLPLLGGCNAIFEPFYEAELKRVRAEEAAVDAKIEEAQNEIHTAIEAERDDALALLIKRAGVERAYEHATVDFRFDLQALDAQRVYNEVRADATIARYDQTLEKLAAERAAMQADHAQRLAQARSNDDWTQMAVGAGLAAIPGVGLALAGIWRGRKNGVADATEEFRDAIAIAREDPEVDRLVSSDSALGRSLRELMRRRPDIEKVVTKDNMHTPATPPTPTVAAVPAPTGAQ